MSTISPGPGTNAAMTPSVQHEQRATSPEASGKIATATAGSNAASAANSFEKRASESGVAH